MAKAETTASRSPRGTKPVSQAFFSALDSIPEASRTAVAKAALGMIRDQMTLQRDKAKAAVVKRKVSAAKENARSPAAEKSRVAKRPGKAKVASDETVPEATAAPKPKVVSTKRRGRKAANAPVLT